jgi:hypothetical protein
MVNIGRTVLLNAVLIMVFNTSSWVLALVINMVLSYKTELFSGANVAGTLLPLGV